MIAAYVTDDPTILGRLNFFVAVIAGVLLVDIIVVAVITRDRRHHRAREAAIDARLARRYGGPAITATARRLLAQEDEDEL